MADGVSAFKAVEIARREVNDEAKGKLVQVVGPPSSVGLMPVEWEILFYDPYADQHGVKVTVSGTAITRIQVGYTQLDKMRLFAYKLEEVIEKKTLKVDSAAAVQALQRSTPLKNIKLSSVALWLRKEGKGPLAPGIWVVELFAPDAKNTKEIKIGEGRVSAQTGQVLSLKVDQKKIEKK